MKHLRRTLLRVLAVPLLVTAWSCSDRSTPTDLLDIPVAKSVVVNPSVGVGDQFMFLPPLAKGNPSEAMATGLDLTVTICGTAGCESIAAKEEGDHYQANWKSDKANDGESFTVTVTGSDYLSGFTLGELEITLAKKGKDKAGRTFPIKFWVGENTPVAEITDCVGDDRCNAEPVPESETDTTTIVTEDENGASMGEVKFPPASVPEGGLIVTLDCREGGYSPRDGPLPTDLDQWPLFCHVDVKNPDGTEFTGALVTDASIEICVVDEQISGQENYHAPVSHHDLRLGKSHTGVDFEFLPEGPESLSCIGNTTQTASASPVGRMIDAIGSRLAWALSPVFPKKLYARRMFRDGGVGGLVSSFSDINPVQPAVIEGAVTNGAGGGVTGVTVTLTGGPLTSPLTTTTDGDGEYSFEPLQAEVGGSAYTVAVSDLPSGSTLATVTQGVNVTGSGVFNADFSCVDCLSGYDFEGGSVPVGSTAQPFWNVTDGAGISNAAVGTQAQLAPDDNSGGALPAAPEGQYYLWYGQPASGNFDNGFSNTGSFTTGPGVVPAGSWSVEFDYWYEVESVDIDLFDIMTVDVIDITTTTTTQVLRLNPTVGVNGQGFEPYTSSGYNLAPTWQTSVIDLSAFAGHQIQLRFNFDSGDFRYNYFRGWALDDIGLVENAPAPAPALKVGGQGLAPALGASCQGIGCDPRAGKPVPTRSPARVNRR